MIAIILPIIFAIHIIVFGSFYFIRGRQIHNLIFCIAFIFLIISRLHIYWAYYTDEASTLDFLDYFSAIGTALCIIATVFFIKYSRQQKQSKLAADLK